MNSLIVINSQFLLQTFCRARKEFYLDLLVQFSFLSSEEYIIVFLFIGFKYLKVF